MTLSDITFISNEAGRTLRERFAALLGSDTRRFDCLVGYFFISGFHKLYPSLENVEKIRILVGLRTDRAIWNLLHEANEPSENTPGPLLQHHPSHAQVQEHIPADMLHELENAPYTAAVETGVQKFLQWIQSGKLDIKAHPSENLHAKVYIMTFQEGDRDVGRVITGSSNLTQAGLQDNLEFNVELKNRSDYDFAAGKFNELWAGAVDVAKPCESAILERSPYAEFTPYELYLKFLYEYFRGELNRPAELDDQPVPKGFKKLKYQEEAVLTAKKILEEYGGVFLSDVVGLGKTYMAAMLAQQLDGRSLVLAPPHLIDPDNPGSWRNVFGDFQVRQTDFESIGTLDALLRRDLTKYRNVFIDESHRFRTETSQTYETLAQICRGKRVILVSATPLNNTPGDVLSQIKLFQNGANSTIPNVRNLNAFFAKLQNKLKGLDRQHHLEAYLNAVQANAKAARESVLKYLMVRRTRTEITKYYGEDLKLQGLTFPAVADPQALLYQLNKEEARILDSTIKSLTRDFKFARYKPLFYFEGERDNHELQSQQNLAKFMKTLMVKRLESSFHAFRLTLGRFIKTYERVITEFNHGHVYISKKHIDKIFALLESDDQQAVQDLLDEDKAEKLDAKDFNSNFLADLQSDLAILQSIHSQWASIKRDPKWESFREILRMDKQLSHGKLIIFTESRETAEYLAGCIAHEVEKKVLISTSHSDEAAYRRVTDNFDARALHPTDDYRILVATEVLSEGVNLHRSNIVINYDIPWNPTRLIQRVGRVNRVGTRFQTIHTYNFFPTDEGNDIIKLKEAAQAKIHAFIEMLGADARLLTDGEELKSHDLFTRLNSKATITGENEQEETEIKYLTEIREIRDKNPELFARVKRLPKKARSTRLVGKTAGPIHQPLPALLTYFRQGQLDKFYVTGPGEPDAAELDFMSAARILKPADTNEPLQNIGDDFYGLFNKNQAAFETATSANAEESVSKPISTNDIYILRRLEAREIRTYHGFTEEDETFIQQVRQSLADGAIPKATSKKTAQALKKESDPLKVLAILRRDIPTLLLQPTRAQQTARITSPREVILSSLLLEAP